MRFSMVAGCGGALVGEPVTGGIAGIGRARTRHGVEPDPFSVPPTDGGRAPAAEGSTLSQNCDLRRRGADVPSLLPWFDMFGDKRPELVNMYGITETTVHVTLRILRREDAQPGRGSVIGRPLPHLSVYVLDANGQPVPIGVRGELYIGGAGVARGYLNRPELTAQRFLENPFGDGKIYRSGDLGRWLALDNLSTWDAWTTR